MSDKNNVKQTLEEAEGPSDSSASLESSHQCATNSVPDGVCGRWRDLQCKTLKKKIRKRSLKGKAQTGLEHRKKERSYPASIFHSLVIMQLRDKLLEYFDDCSSLQDILELISSMF